MKPEMVEMFTNQLNTVAPVFETLRKANKAKDQVNRTATYGTPLLFVFEKIFGADPDRDIEYRTREPE